jgi:signal transduction histidine kinase
MKPGAPGLDGAQFERAFPFHLWLDDGLRLLRAGSALRKALPALVEGTALGDAFEVARPRGAVDLADWRRHGTALCTLRARGEVRLTLRGNAELLDDGSLLLLVSPVLTSLDEVRRLGLNFNDFARHDAAGELLLAARTTQMSARDSERLAERLQARTELLNSILELSHNGVLAFGADGVLQHCNAAVVRMFGVRADRLAGATLDEVDALIRRRLPPAARGRGVLVPPQDDAAPVDRLLLARPRKAVIELSSRPRDEGGQVFYLRDITRETEVERMKSEFLTTAAHELRTPMVSVHGFTELLLNRPVSDAKRRDMLETIHRQSSLLIHMVNELLDLARIEARQGSDLQRVPCRLEALVRDAVAPFGDTAGRHAICLSLGHGDAQVLLDPEKTHRALTNVLSNAIKYSPDGGTVEVSTLDSELGGRPALTVRVRDEGIGMTAEQVARVFERFYRADPSGNIPGTGLGMSLVKEITELQGGAVQVSSRPGRGTTVELTWPLLRDGPEDAAVPAGDDSTCLGALAEAPSHQ